MHSSNTRLALRLAALLAVLCVCGVPAGFSAPAAPAAPAPAAAPADSAARGAGKPAGVSIAPTPAGAASPWHFVPARPDTAPLTDDARRAIAVAESTVRANGGPRAEHASLLLTWKAPYGQKGAVSALLPALADTAAADTLYLCMIPGRTSPTFNGFTATLRFRCVAGDTLGDFWHFERTGANAGALAVQFGPQPGLAFPTPWIAQGVGKPSWVPEKNGAVLKLVFAVPYTQSAGVDSAKAYCLARVFLRHKGAKLSGRTQPMCIEWEESSLAFALRDEPVVRRGERFVSWNSPHGDACAAFGGPAKPAPWSPAKPKHR